MVLMGMFSSARNLVNVAGRPFGLLVGFFSWADVVD